MKYLLALIALILGIFHPIGTLSAQSLDLGGRTTRAVVIGISDYLQPLIPDLTCSQATNYSSFSHVFQLEQKKTKKY